MRTYLKVGKSLGSIELVLVALSIGLPLVGISLIESASGDIWARDTCPSNIPQNVPLSFARGGLRVSVRGMEKTPYPAGSERFEANFTNIFPGETISIDGFTVASSFATQPSSCTPFTVPAAELRTLVMPYKIPLTVRPGDYPTNVTVTWSYGQCLVQQFGDCVKQGALQGQPLSLAGVLHVRSNFRASLQALAGDFFPIAWPSTVLVTAGSIVFALQIARQHRTKLSFASADASFNQSLPNFSRLPSCKTCGGYNLPGASSCRHCGGKLST